VVVCSCADLQKTFALPAKCKIFRYTASFWYIKTFLFKEIVLALLQINSRQIRCSVNREMKISVFTTKFTFAIGSNWNNNSSTR
jgi:hypothetical protein